MYEERGKTLPDGRIEVIVSDPSTGQEVVRYYSPGAEPKVSLGDLVLKGGFLRDELMPPSVAKKGDLTPLATKEELRTATRDVVRTADVEDVVRKSALFDTAHNMILPELIPEAEVAVKWLKGKGRPDKPETTEGAIVGDEAECTRYLSTDGAGTGAWEWEKRGGVWHVVRGDTGWRRIMAPIMPRVRILFRRIGTTVHMQVDGGFYPYFQLQMEFSNPLNDYPSTCKILMIPDGFKSCSTPFWPISTLNGLHPKYAFWITKEKGNPNPLLVLSYSALSSEDVLCPACTYLTVDAWPSSLPGESAEAICPTT